jgi:hypothetical protein
MTIAELPDHVPTDRVRPLRCIIWLIGLSYSVNWRAIRLEFQRLWRKCFAAMQFLLLTGL